MSVKLGLILSCGWSGDRMDWDGLGQDKVLKSIERAGRAAAGIR